MLKFTLKSFTGKMKSFTGSSVTRNTSLAVVLVMLTGLCIVECDDSRGYYNFAGLNETVSLPNPAICPYTTATPGLGGIEYLFSIRDDYGWGSFTHRAIIALALNDFGNSTEDEVKLMLHQFDVELSITLLRSTTAPMLSNDLALYVSALISVNRNPRDFHGRNLVAILEQHARDPEVHPYVILTLCNARAITAGHLKHLVKYIEEDNHNDRQLMELKALSVKAYFCSKEENIPIPVKVDVKKAVQCLIGLQKSNGSFGNVYTTSLAMQALIAANNDNWDEKNAVAFLLKQRTVDVSVISTYYIEMALRSRQIKFLKRLKKNQEIQLTDLEILLGMPRRQSIQYSVWIGEVPQVYLTLTMKIPLNISFFQAMKIAAHENSAFRFKEYKTKEGNYEIYSISDVPNDSERGLYWNLFLNSRPKYLLIQEPPNTYMPKDSDHFIYWYKESLKLMRNVRDNRFGVL